MILSWVRHKLASYTVLTNPVIRLVMIAKSQDLMMVPTSLHLMVPTSQDVTTINKVNLIIHLVLQLTAVVISMLAIKPTTEKQYLIHQVNCSRQLVAKAIDRENSIIHLVLQLTAV